MTPADLRASLADFHREVVPVAEETGIRLAIHPDEFPPVRLANLIMQRRARWLLSRTDKLFLPPLDPNP